MISDVKYLVASDLHYLKKGRTKKLIENFNLVFDNYSDRSEMIDLDIIFLAGDVFDHITDITSGELDYITIWFRLLLSFCERHDIILRILEGTPSHDWKQSSYLSTLHSVYNTKVDFKYIDSVHIERIDKFQLDVLYVPDEWSSSADQTFNDVKNELKNNNIDMVDIAIMHGMFTYQLKGVGKEKIKHSEQSYLNIVRYYINIGHIHNYSFFDRIIAQGSR